MVGVASSGFSLRNNPNHFMRKSFFISIALISFFASAQAQTAI
jgi:hypothetical protein